MTYHTLNPSLGFAIGPGSSGAVVVRENEEKLPRAQKGERAHDNHPQEQSTFPNQQSRETSVILAYNSLTIIEPRNSPPLSHRLSVDPALPFSGNFRKRAIKSPSPTAPGPVLRLPRPCHHRPRASDLAAIAQATTVAFRAMTMRCVNGRSTTAKATTLVFLVQRK